MLIPTDHPGRVEAILVNSDRAASLVSGRVDSVTVTYAGFDGEAHSGLTRASCPRFRRQYEKGTEIRNTRQISILSSEELALIAEAMEIETVQPEWVGANLVLSGIPDFTLLPPSSRLIFENGASLVVDMENAPCRFPGDVMEEFHPQRGRRFPKAAQHLRGVTAWVEKEGSIATGEAVVAHVPAQRPWPHMPL